MLCFLLWLSSSCFLCSQCYQCLLVVHSGFVLWFSLTVVFPSPLFFSMLCCIFVCLRPVSCVPNVASVSWFALWFSLTFVFPSLYFFVLSCVFCLYSSWVLFPQCCQCLSSIRSWLPLRLPVSLNCPLWICPVVFSNVYLLISLVLVFFSSSWGLHVHCCLCLSIIHLWIVISINAFFNIS